MSAIKAPNFIFYEKTKHKGTLVLCQKLELRPRNQDHLMPRLDLGKNFIKSFRFAKLKEYYEVL